MAEYTTKDAIEFAADGDVSNFKQAVNDILMNKVRDVVDVKRVEVATSFLSPSQEDYDDEAEDEQQFEGEEDESQEV